ncbi:hypothetical protein D3C80_1012010 [compost metagenome]
MGEIGLARKVRAVADPDRQSLGADGVADFDALDIVLDGLGAGGGIGMAERAVFVGMSLAGGVGKRVGVHRVEAEAERISLCLQVLRVGLVPRDMQRDSRCRAGQLIDDGAVFQLVENSAGFALAGKTGKPGTTGTDAPGRNGDEKLRNLFRNGFDIDAAAGQVFAEGRIVGAVRCLVAFVVFADHIGRNHLVRHFSSSAERTNWLRLRCCVQLF